MSEGPVPPDSDVNPAEQDDLLLCRVTGPDTRALRDFVETSRADLGCRPVAQRTGAGVATRVELTKAALDSARINRAADLVEIEVLENLTRTQVARQAEVRARAETDGLTGRIDDGQRATGYLDVAGIESALSGLHAAHPGLTELITVPHSTHEGRSCSVLRIGTLPGNAADGLLVLGGVHAREWVPPDALVALARDLLTAYAHGTGLSYGGANYPAGEIARLLETLNLFVFPCVNPDGRAFTQTGNANWRKNRRPAPGGGGPSCIGVDLNRNFDFLWDHTARFAANAGVNTSADPCDPMVYRGPSAASEPETQNVVWLLDTHPRIRWHLDVHSAVPVVLYSWGSDQDQTTSPGESFLNPALDAVRGRLGDGIGEYLPAAELGIASTLATRLNDGIKAVRAIDYGVEQAMTLYPTSGASDDYAYSRHFADPARTRVFAWTVECGSSFQPPWSEAEHVIAEVGSGIIRWALAAHEVTDGLSVSLGTAGLAFIGVPEGETTARPVTFTCSGDLDVHFDVIAGPGANFGLPLGTATTVPAPGAGVSTPGRVWVSWTAGPAGTTATSTVTVRCRETAQQWTIPISADSIVRPTVAVALVLDRSGSMAFDAGDGRSRAEVLREAAGIFVDLVPPDDGVGVVRFDHDADTATPVAPAGPEVFGPGRAAAAAAVAAHQPNPLGATSIGDGILTGSVDLALAGPGFTGTAMIVLTDGQENAPAFLADVAGSITDIVFAIGLGEPSAINPAALSTIAHGTGGWVAVSGNLSVDERFLLAQYFLQVLAGVTNQQIVVS